MLLHRADSLHPEGERFAWPYFGLTRPLNSDKRRKMQSKSPQASQRLCWSRCGVKISTDLMVDRSGRKSLPCPLRVCGRAKTVLGGYSRTIESSR